MSVLQNNTRKTKKITQFIIYHTNTMRPLKLYKIVIFYRRVIFQICIGCAQLMARSFGGTPGRITK